MELRKLSHDLGSVISTLKVVEAALKEKNLELAELVGAALERLSQISDAAREKPE